MVSGIDESQIRTLEQHIREQYLMRNLGTALQQELIDTFGRHVTFDRLERRFYRSDVGSLPNLVAPLVGNTTPAGVVQPHTESQLVTLARFSQHHGVPLVPRGKATSGYGGVLPVKGGLVVDMSWMRQILEVSRENETVTVQAGVVWGRLEKELHKLGLALTTYPSSAPSSTVGGWLAQGGVGYGAYEFGSFRDTVVSARVVLPSGDVRDFAGTDLDLISDAEGITGLISSVTLRIRKLEPERVWALSFRRPAELANAFIAIQKADLPLWSISFITPTMAKLKNQLPPKLVHGHPIERQCPELPESYLAVMVAPASRASAIEPALKQMASDLGGELLNQSLAIHEWEERFNIMHIKRLGPSLVPAEVVVPLAGLASTLSGLNERIRLPMAVEGMVSRTGEVTLLGFILHDERTLGFNVAFGLALTVLKLAKGNGGRAYSTGLFFAREADQVLGMERRARLAAFKRDVDPEGLFNPGKVLNGKSVLSAFMGLAGALEPLVRALGNAAGMVAGERLSGNGKRGIPDDVAWYAYACAQCGYCVDDCDQYYGRGWESQTPRGKWKYLRDYMEGKITWNQQMVDTILACTTCELCNVRCPLELPIEPSWLKLRGRLIHEEQRLTFPPFEIMRASLRKEQNIWGAMQHKRADWARDVGLHDLPEKADIAYFAGCTASYVEKDIAQASALLLKKAGVPFTLLGTDEACCGIPMLVSGLWDTWQEIMEHNIDAMNARGVKTVVTSCPACWLVWNTFYPEWARKLGKPFHFQARHYSELLAEKLSTGGLVLDQPVHRTLTWHDSCHMGRAGGIYEPPRQLIKAIPGVQLVEMEHNREDGHCCGSVLSLVADPAVAERIGDLRLREAEEVGADGMVACCPCCQVQLRVTIDKRQRSLEVIDLAHLVADAAGISLVDPTAYAMEQWATFEAMILLLKPQAMAGFMASMFPEMIAAMPAPFRSMMHMVHASPAPLKNAMLGIMQPMMPFLFPRLLPGMMPTVMPTMLEKIGEIIPMSEDMKTLMPDLMPAAMGNLMPKMLPEVMPYVVPAMIEYLRSGNGAEAAT